MSVFDDLVGQAAVTEILTAAVAGDGMSHAWMFTGPPGSGRSVAARAFAAALQCADGGCGHCAQCAQVLARTHPDVVFVTPAGLSISVDEARDVVHRAAISASGARWRIVLIEDADRLTERAANVWLKAIEEPVAGSVFLLCAPSADDLPPTIRSRCRLVTLRLPTADDVAAVLMRRDGVDDSMARWAAGASMGHVGRARALALDEAARAERKAVLDLPRRLTTVGDALAAAAELVADAEESSDRGTSAAAKAETEAYAAVTGKGRGTGALFSDLARRQKSRETRARRDTLDRALVDLAALYRDVLAVQFGAGDNLVHGDQVVLIRRLAENSTPASSIRRADAVLACREALDLNANVLLAVEALALSLRAG
ncbi:MAG: DNA polymerase III subunit delta' [Mycobacteriales bacterium]